MAAFVQSRGGGAEAGGPHAHGADVAEDRRVVRLFPGRRPTLLHAERCEPVDPNRQVLLWVAMKPHVTFSRNAGAVSTDLHPRGRSPPAGGALHPDGGIERQQLEEALRVVASHLFKGKDKEACMLDEARKLSHAE